MYKNDTNTYLYVCVFVYIYIISTISPCGTQVRKMYNISEEKKLII
jgi:hypothetical protein